MDKQIVEEYLKRIGLDEMPPVNAEGLKTIQQAHLRTIPFENLDLIEDRVPLKLDEASLVDKLIRHKRGGICYEQNILLGDILREMGYGVEIRGARILPHGTFYDHVCVLVDIPVEAEDGEPATERWVADVGFGFNFACPLKLEFGLKQDDGRNVYYFEDAADVGEGFIRLMRSNDEGFGQAFTINPEPRTREDFQPRCDFYATSPESGLKQKNFFGIDCAEYRATLTANHLTTTVDGVKTVIDIESDEQFETYLRDLFHIER